MPAKLLFLGMVVLLCSCFTPRETPEQRELRIMREEIRDIKQELDRRARRVKR